MATRVIENRRDRLTTILIAPLMSCSARLPVYTLMIAAFIPDRQLAGRADRAPGPDRCSRCTLLGIVVGRRGGPVLEADPAPRRDAAVPDGAAGLQVAVAARGPAPDVRPRLGFPAQRRHDHLRRLDRDVGRALLPADLARASSRLWRPSGAAGSASATTARAAGDAAQARRPRAPAWPTSPTAWRERRSGRACWAAWAG